MNVIESVAAARQSGVPLIAIKTVDPAATVKQISDKVSPKAPKIHWEMIQGYKPVNDLAGSSQAVGLTKDCANSPLEALKAARSTPENTIVFMQMTDRFLAMPPVIQAIWNLRDQFKSTGRTLIMMGADMDLPAELRHDVLSLDEPLPTEEQLHSIVTELIKAADLQVSDEQIAETVNAVNGLSSFEAEQVTAMSIDFEKRSINIEQCWERKRKMIEQTKGLTVFRGNDRFEDLAGLEQVKRYVTGMMNGPRKPKAIVWLDELEKSGLAHTGDLSGVNSDQLGTVLSYMEDRKVFGLMLVGVPGAGKSALCKAMGAEFGRLVIRMDMGAMQGSLVGESQQNLRKALKTVDAIGGSNTLFVATSNSIDGLDVALKSRFTGTFFFDLPTKEQLTQAWEIHKKLEGVDGEPPDDTGWSGRNVQRCCQEAASQRISLVEAANYIIPELVSNREAIEHMRKAAEGKYLSSCYPGPYQQAAKIVNVSKKRSFG